MNKNSNGWDTNRTLTKQQAIVLIERITHREDPYWDEIIDEFYHEETDTMPNIYHIFAALGITKEEYCEALSYVEPNNVKWPAISQKR